MASKEPIYLFGNVNCGATINTFEECKGKAIPGCLLVEVTRAASAHFGKGKVNEVVLMNWMTENYGEIVCPAIILTLRGYVEK